MRFKRICGHALIIIGCVIAFYVGGYALAYKGITFVTEGVRTTNGMLVFRGIAQFIFSATAAFTCGVPFISCGSWILKTLNKEEVIN